jgi:hypothetical protein
MSGFCDRCCGVKAAEWAVELLSAGPGHLVTVLALEEDEWGRPTAQVLQNIEYK